jgi:hypothetical protein
MCVCFRSSVGSALIVGTVPEIILHGVRTYLQLALPIRYRIIHDVYKQT